MPDELLTGADPGAGSADPETDQGADATAGQMTGAASEAASDTPTFLDPTAVPAELQDHFKRMQASFTRAMQDVRKQRDDLGQVKDKAALVDRFYSDRQYAAQILQQLAPQLGFQLTPQGTPGPQGTPTPQTTSPAGDLTTQLQQSLGPDLAFLAGPLGGAMERIISARVESALKPFGEQLRGQSEAAKRQEQEKLLAEVDGKYPGWEQTYGAKMKDLDAFLASDALAHPHFGSKYELYLRLLNPDLARVDAIRGMAASAQNRTSTGRTGRPAAPNFRDTLRTTNKEQGWNAAWELAAQNLEMLAREAEEGLQ